MDDESILVDDEFYILKQIADGRTDLVFEWVEEGNSVDMKWAPPGRKPRALLEHCFRFGDVSAVRYLISQGAKIPTPLVEAENLDLHSVAYRCHWQMVQYLVEAHGAKVRMEDGDTGETPLHVCLCKDRLGSYQTARVLLAHGASPNARTKAGKETVYLWLDARTRAETPLHRAAAFSSEQTIQLLLDCGADKRSRDDRGDTPLSWASWHRRPAHILKLLSYDDYTIEETVVNQSRKNNGLTSEIYALGIPHVKKK